MEQIDLKSAQEKAKAFCVANLAECCKELTEWRTCGILRDGKLRDLAALCEVYVGDHDGIRIAESMVNDHACALFAAVLTDLATDKDAVKQEEAATPSDTLVSACFSPLENVNHTVITNLQQKLIGMQTRVFQLEKQLQKATEKANGN